MPMKKSFWILIIMLITPFYFYGQKGDNHLKIITYNIWNGFDWGKDTTRRAQLQEWMAEQRPDVLALQELCAYTPEKLQEDAEKWGHRYAVLLKTSGYSVGLTSRYPVEVKEKIFYELHHGALHCKTNGIDFLVVHLHPGSIQRRREEAKILLKKLETISLSNSKYIVLGDFNAHSAFDADFYDPNEYFMSRLIAANAGKGLSGNVVDGALDYAVMSGFLSFPLYDVAQKFTKSMAERGSFPGRVLGPINNETEEQLVSRLERIDYILASPELAPNCIKAKVGNGQSNWFLSDHYPVIAEFTLKD